MKLLRFWFDPVSPYAYLAFERLPQVLVGLSYSVEYRPVLFAGLLAHWGHKGPAEIEPKRAWTFRQVEWLALRHGIALQTPLQHPFNPIALLRMALACASAGEAPNRRVVEAVFRHVWCGNGADANDAVRLETLRQLLAPQRDPQSAEVKDELREAGREAIERGVFGVPTIELEGRLFWGLDSLEMVAQCLRGEPWFAAGWDAAGAPRSGLQRKRS
ncbi:MAG: 2-hydroxychromene-2-carboxylate isomerase [Burkholderiaceae bacterium]